MISISPIGFKVISKSCRGGRTNINAQSQSLQCFYTVQIFFLRACTHIDLFFFTQSICIYSTSYSICFLFTYRLIHIVLRSNTYNFNPHWFTNHDLSIHPSIHNTRSWRSSSLGHRFWSQCIVYFHDFLLSASKYNILFTYDRCASNAA